MRTVSQTEAMRSLPNLFKEAKSQLVTVQDEKGELFAIVPMEEYRTPRPASFAEFERLRKQAFEEIKKNAEVRGENVEDVLEDLLRR